MKVNCDPIYAVSCVNRILDVGKTISVCPNILLIKRILRHSPVLDSFTSVMTVEYFYISGNFGGNVAEIHA